MSPPLPTTRPPGLSATQPSSLPPSSLPPPPYLPTPPTPTRLPLVGIDCTSVGVTHQPYDGGYLNVEVPLTPTPTLTLALALTLTLTLTHVSGGAPRAATLPGARLRGLRPAAERLDERAGQRRLCDLTNPYPNPTPRQELYTLLASLDLGGERSHLPIPYPKQPGAREGYEP